MSPPGGRFQEEPLVLSQTDGHGLVVSGLEGDPEGRGLPPTVRGAGAVRSRHPHLVVSLRLVLVRRPAATLRRGACPPFLPASQIRKMRREKARSLPRVTGRLLLQTPAQQKLPEQTLRWGAGPVGTSVTRARASAAARPQGGANGR